MRKTLLSCLALVASGTIANAAVAGPMGENLDRGVIAMKTSSGVFVSWRSLTADPRDLTFDVYRDGVKVNAAPITGGTNITDPAGTTSSKYKIVASDGSQSKETAVEGDVYKRIHLDRPGNDPRTNATYTPNDCSLGDVDGDGEYEIFVKWDPSNSHDNSEDGGTGNVLIDCYKLDGTKLWRIDLGQNIRAGAHYTQFMVYDFDQDGKAEMMVKTAPGTKDGTGKYVIMGNDDPSKSYINSKGHVISGPEYLTVFNGLTGAEINTIAYNPPRDIKTAAEWGALQTGSQKSDNTNRPERYLACVAYLDGEKPSGVFCRGYYTHAYLWAVDFDGKNLTQKWFHKSETKKQGAYGEGAHSLTVGDVDGDGKDEIVYGSACIDHDGSLLYRTGGGHGDALHLGDFDPDREGLEVFMVHEETDSYYPYDTDFRDAKTGEIIWALKQSGNDIGRGLIADISENWRGYECWPQSFYGFDGKEAKQNASFDCKGNLVAPGKRADVNFRIYWDGDLLDELFDGKYDSTTKVCAPHIVKRNAALTSNAKEWTFSQYDAVTCNTTKSTPNLQADLFGDWREEVIMWDKSNSSDLLIFSTTIETKYRVPTLMEDHNYRLAIAWQNCAYNQPPHLGYYLSDRFSTDARIKVTSGTPTQSMELGKEFKTVEGTFELCDDVKATGLPAGVEITVDKTAGTFTISGTPEAIGSYKFTVTTVGGEGSASIEGTITVTAPVVLTEVAHFSFDEMTSTVPNLKHGEADVKGSPTLVDGIYGKAISFNGESDYLEQAAYADIQMDTKDFTLEFWFKSNDNAAYIFHKGSIAANSDTGTTGHWIGIERKNDNIYFAIDDNVTKTQATVLEASKYFNDEWHHIVCTRSSANSELRVYLDGVLVASATDKTGAIKDNNEPLCIGNVNVDHNNYYKGLMDDLHIYHGAMSADTVKEHYEAATKSGIENVEFGFGEGPIHHTLIDARTGMTVATAWGAEENVTTGAQPGVYILVSEQGRAREIKKIVL